jgi:hypothetical protein
MTSKQKHKCILHVLTLYNQGLLCFCLHHVDNHVFNQECSTCLCEKWRRMDALELVRLLDNIQNDAYNFITPI